MSHQTGIQAGNDVKDVFAKARNGDQYRVIKVVIEAEQLTMGTTGKASKKWDQEYDYLVVPSWRRRALLCSVPAGLHQQPGLRSHTEERVWGGHIKDEIFGRNESEWIQEISDCPGCPLPLTAAEEELRKIKLNEVQTDISVDTKQQTLQGVAFPIHQDAIAALERFRDKRVNYVQLEVDAEKELIRLSNTEPTELKDLPLRIPKESARYHFFLYKHSHEGDYLESTVFIYSMPGYNCSIRERMLYSSCKNPLVDMVEHNLQIEIEKKLEIDNGDELTGDFLYEEVHPKQHAHKQAFAKPKGPTGKRGVRRITRPAPEGEERD
ncbi:hypothetical protein F7725_023131 [Dissostichus mawsoni]|uniref:Twinfilin-1 n=1 Tax=Dissostichus mawsoni TaxID=36200 RepID=A0A7J5Z088_DISMA|nr:hypothetical protein F7725_023131 [Dissostichus mawsoni]